MCRLMLIALIVTVGASCGGAAAPPEALAVAVRQAGGGEGDLVEPLAESARTIQTSVGTCEIQAYAPDMARVTCGTITLGISCHDRVGVDMINANDGSIKPSLICRRGATCFDTDDSVREVACP